jgi:hypothetical protein
VSEPDQAVTWRPRLDDHLQADLSAFEDSANTDGRASTDSITGLVSFGFLMAALRRRRRVWLTFAVIGLIIGAGIYVARPAAHKATVSVLLGDGTGMIPSDQIVTDQSMAHSFPVAAAVISQLGLRETPASFLATYTVTDPTDRVLMISVSAATSDEAVRTSNAIATQFLKFRDQYAENQQQLTDTALNQQLDLARQHLDSINAQISQVSAESSSAAHQATLASLKAQSSAANGVLGDVEQYVGSTSASTRAATLAMTQGSEILNSPAAAASTSRLKGMVLYAGGGLVGGWAIGIVIVIIMAITSDRLLRRDDIAHVIGAPVRLSIGGLHRSRLVPTLPGRAAIRRRDQGRFVAHLRNAVPERSNGPASLAVVAVDDVPTVAQGVIALAVSCAEQQRVVLGDLSAGAYAARSLRVDGPGTSMASPDGMPIMVAVPAADDVAPVGPLQHRALRRGAAQADESLIAACARADLVLSLVTLDPAFSADHLATWATDAVAVVTAGRSTAVRIRAVGEMIRLSGVRLSSVVVIDADKADESLGTPGTAYNPAL